MSAFKFDYPQQLIANLYSTTKTNQKPIYSLLVSADLFMHDSSMFGSAWRDRIAVYDLKGFKTFDELCAQFEQTVPQVHSPIL
jgi:hypothetical protein